MLVGERKVQTLVQIWAAAAVLARLVVMAMVFQQVEMAALDRQVQ
jgi:hypothetical protein